jgi:hypothetical protein
MAAKKRVAKKKPVARTTARPKADFDAVHARLLAILKKYERKPLASKESYAGGYCLIGPPNEASKGRDVWFAGLKIGKAYVSYHLMTVYMFPDLLKGLSPALKKRMQGKSCFNFTAVDEALFKELAQLTAAGYERFRREGLL